MDVEQEISRLTEEIKHDAQALSSISAAKDTFNSLARLGLDYEQIVRSSLLHAGIIHYARPFKSSNFKGNTFKYPKGLIENAKNYDKEIHDHLMDMRDKLVAHSDDTELPPEVVWRGVAITNESMTDLDQSENAVPNSLAVVFGILKSLDNEEALRRICKHVSSVSEYIFEILSSKMHQLFLLGLSNRVQLKVNAKVVGSRNALTKKIRSICLDPNWEYGACAIDCYTETIVQRDLFIPQIRD